MLLNNFTPPIVKKIIKNAFFPSKVYSSFESAQQAIANQSGYDSNGLIDFIFNKTKNFIAEINQKTEIALENHHLFLLTLIGFLSKKEKLTVLDFGGAFGTHYFVVKKFFPHLSLNWKVLELPQLVSKAKVLENNEITFIESTDNFTADLGKFDLVLTSGTLQHMPDPEKTVAFLHQFDAPYLALLRLGINLSPLNLWSIHKARFKDFGPGQSPENCPSQVIAFPFCLMSDKKLASLLLNYQLILSTQDMSGTTPIDNYQIQGFNRLYKRIE